MRVESPAAAADGACSRCRIIAPIEQQSLEQEVRRISSSFHLYFIFFPSSVSIKNDSYDSLYSCKSAQINMREAKERKQKRDTHEKESS